MKVIYSLLLICLFVFDADATHLYGGYITTQKITGRVYEIKLVVYSDPNSPADENTASVNLNFGDGTVEEVQRFSSYRESHRVQKNTYVVRHEYQVDGVFAILFSDNNLVNGIININHGRSEDQALTIQTIIHINAAVNDKYGSDPLAFELCNAAGSADHVLTYNPVFIDRDNDSMSYELLPTADLSKLGYEIPEGMSVNAFSGTISWPMSGISPGTYLLYYRINTYRSGLLLTSSYVGQPFFVNYSTTTFPSVVASGCDKAPAGWFRKILNPGDALSLDFISGIKQESRTYSLDAYSFLFYKNADSSSSISAEEKTIHINWQTTTQDITNLPYYIVYRQRNPVNQCIQDHVVGVYVGAAVNTGLNNSAESEYKIEVYPNPVNRGCTFSFESPGQVELSIHDIAGKQVFKSMIGNDYQWKRQDLMPGLYTYTIFLPAGSVIRGKLILD